MEAEREYRNTKYHIVIENPDCVSKGVAKITIDGIKLEGNLLPVYGDETVHKVMVNLSNELSFSNELTDKE